MSKVKYRYNPETLSYDKINKGSKYYISRASIYFMFVLLVGMLTYLIYPYVFQSPVEKRLERENHQLLAQYDIMNKKLDQLELVLEDIELRDENIYRTIFQADSIPSSIRRAGFGGVNRYRHLEDMDNAELVINTAKRLDVVMKQLYVQSTSFDEVISLAMRKEEMLRCTPAIMPISNADLKRTASGWGYRIHPIYKVKKFHEGMDFSAPIGTDIYATADGVVTKITNEKTGYGKRIEVDHGFGYTTLYAHLDEFNVRRGQKVKRGDVIGYVGNTGGSTAPHLHYEVHVKGKKVNPQHYYFKEDLTAEEYDKMIQISSNSNQTFD
ncbi:M23 family metallopeptidase [Carboxylicivirga mesophila]|uniref:M23 family metallopeptidase n=1 Tax=Carboxylicivirga mesophila TaxID=1166478 RepID=A0ABS5K4G2_9BACT|nr:M23 family metallopeptidase [Carboxylicivirga mesophila]MBS2209901.1 M23 family metallopeptidase [Carboxylicivirga mesophila]